MKQLIIIAAICLLWGGVGSHILAQTPTTGVANSERYARVRIFTDREGLERLERLGVAVDHGYYRPDVYFTVELSTTELQRVREAGFQCEVLIDDLVTYYQERAATYFEQLRQGTLPSETARSSAYSCEETNVGNPDYPVPANFQLGSMGGYFTYEEAMQRLDDLSNLYPDYVSSQAPIGDFLTHEQRRIYWLRVSDNPATDEADEPEVLMTAVHHAREPGGLSQMIFFLYYLLENKDTNPEFKFLLDHTELYLVPILNPDGYIYNQTTNPNGGGFWRKNKRDNNNDGSFSENNDGVDLNRNYGHFWGYDDNGSSPSPSSATYRGTEGFSEPEIQAMKSFCEQHQFQIALNYHTYSNLLIYPWGHIPSFYTPDSALFVNLAKVMTYENNYIYGTGDQTVGYVTNGDSDDWMYGEQDTKNKILSMTPEVGTQGDGFWASPDRIIPQCKENVWQNLHLLRFVHHYAQLTTDNLPYFIQQPIASATFKIQRLGLKDNGTFTVSIEPLTGIASMTDPITFTDLDLLESATAALTYSLMTDYAGEFSYNLVVDNNEGLVQKYLIKQYYGSANTIYANTCDNMLSFENSVWAATIDDYYTAPASITDSPFGEYADNTYSTLLLSDVIDLSNTNIETAKLDFWAKWDIENDYDYVQLRAYSPVAENYFPLCGKYTNAGVNDQPFDEPIYDGIQAEWVKETIDLSEFIGQTIQLEWTFGSDGFVTGDGFYFDDLEVYTTLLGVGTQNVILPNTHITAQPNPANKEVTIRYQLLEASEAILYLHNIVGQTVISQKLPTQQNQLNLSTAHLPNGTYTYYIQTPKGKTAVQKLVVQH
jgi:hypothetical protein